MKLLKRLFVPDLHAPYLDRAAFELMLSVAQDFKPQEVVFLGDFFDAECVKTHEPNALRNPRFLEDELQEGRNALKQVEVMSGAKSFVFLEGNHEDRIRRYIAINAPKLAKNIDVKQVLGIPDYYRYLKYGQEGHYRMGNWLATHGTLCGKYCAAAMLAKYGVNVIFGHVHRVQEARQTRFSDMIRAVSCGWLGVPRTAGEYIRDVPDWQLGFGLGYWKPNGQAFIEVVEIQNYSCVFAGEIYGRTR
jgi:predicted phosphodiesterase